MPSHLGEDQKLAALLRDIQVGFYLDIGANNPYTSSNSHPFYLRGWRGIDVEPLPQMASLLKQAHPENRVVECAVGSRNGRVILYGQQDWEGSTLLADYARGHSDKDYLFLPMEVELRTLNDILDGHTGPIDFMSMDIEGSEAEALQGMNLYMYRPRVMVIEATLPCTEIPCWEAWEPYVLSHGYEFVLFDGYNRFYVRSEDAWRSGNLV